MTNEDNKESHKIFATVKSLSSSYWLWLCVYVCGGGGGLLNHSIQQFEEIKCNPFCLKIFSRFSLVFLVVVCYYYCCCNYLIVMDGYNSITISFIQVWCKQPNNQPTHVFFFFVFFLFIYSFIIIMLVFFFFYSFFSSLFYSIFVFACLGWPLFRIAHWFCCNGYTAWW